MRELAGDIVNPSPLVFLEKKIIVATGNDVIYGRASTTFFINGGAVGILLWMCRLG